MFDNPRIAALTNTRRSWVENQELLSLISSAYYMGKEPENADENNVLGLWYENVKKDYTRAFEYYQRAYVDGSTDAGVNLASMYMHGRGVPKDINKAIKILEEMHDQGNMYASYSLGAYHYNNMHISDQQIIDRYLKKSYEAGNISAAKLLSRMYYDNSNYKECLEIVRELNKLNVNDQKTKALVYRLYRKGFANFEEAKDFENFIPLACDYKRCLDLIKNGLMDKSVAINIPGDVVLEYFLSS